MQKSDILQHLRDAKAAHIQWVQRAKLLIEGFDVDKQSIPVNATECKFGQWFYSDAQKLNALRNNNLDCMNTIESLHFKLHDIYLQIFKIYFGDQNKGFFAKLFKRKNSVSEESKAYAKKLYHEMEEVSKELLEEVNKMERRVLAIPDSELEEII